MESFVERFAFTPPNSPMISNETIQFVNCRLIRKGMIVRDDLWVRKGKILNPEPVFYDEKIKADRILDCNNAIISPGFIDVQINGKKYKLLFYLSILEDYYLLIYFYSFIYKL